VKKIPLSFILSLVILFFLFTVSTIADSLPDNLVGMKVFVKYNLIFPGQVPKVYADDIIFIENQQICDAAIWEYVIPKSAEVMILNQEDRGDFVCLTIAPGFHGNLDILQDQHDILIAKSANGDFEPAFNRGFSFDKVEETYVETCDAKNEAELIESLGFPIYKCTKDGFTYFYYNLGFLGCRVNSYHDIWFKLQDGKVIGDYGNI
jgi:hypothetical protein